MAALVRSKKLGMFEPEPDPAEDEKLKNEQILVERRRGVGEMPDDMLTDFGFAMGRLHDPCNFDHSTLEAMLATYHFRDLAKSKLFRIAKKIFGDKMDSKYRIRNRTFNVVGLKHGSPGMYLYKKYICKYVLFT